jgi:hypothetical protein
MPGIGTGWTAGGLNEANPVPEPAMAVRKQSRLTDTPKLGRKDRYPSDYGVRDAEEAKAKKSKNRSWSHEDKGQGREGRSKGIRRQCRTRDWSFGP